MNFVYVLHVQFYVRLIGQFTEYGYKMRVVDTAPQSPMRNSEIRKALKAESFPVYY
jgi:hypothetical protein